MKITRRHSATAIFVAACKGPGEPGSDPTFTLREERAWAGGTIRIHATGVAKTHGTLEARVGTLPAGITRMDDSTFVLDVPGASSGSRPVTITGGGESFEAGTVHVAGFDSWTMIDLFAVSYSMLPLEDPTDAVVALSSVAGLELINLSAGTRVSYPAYRPDCMVAPNPSYRPGVVTIDDDQGVVHALQYDHASSDLLAVGRMDAPDNAPPCGYSYCYSATLVQGSGPAIYFVLAHGDLKILRFNLLDE